LFSPCPVLVVFLVAKMHLHILSDSCHSTSAPYFCIRGWAVGLSEAAIPQQKLPPHHKDKKWEHFQLGIMKCLVRPNKDSVATLCDLILPVKW